MTTSALKVSAGWKPPAWATMHNLELAGGVLVVVLLAFTVLRLSKGHRPAPAPVAAPKRSGGGKLLLGAAAAVGGLVLFERNKNAAAPAKAAPAPVPTPTPRPTVTQTVAPHAAPHLTLPVHLTGGDIVAMFVVGGIVAIVIILGVLRRGES